MASTPSTPKHSDSSNNNNLGKRKKSRGSKGSFLSKWLDKTTHHIQEASPSMDYDYVPSMIWPNASQFAPGFDPCRFNMYGCTPEPASLPTLPTYYNPPFYGPECRYMHNKSVQVQRPRRRRSDQKVEEVHSSNTTPNSTLNYLQPKNFIDSQDYTSLPPIITSVGDTNSTTDMNANEKNDADDNRRFSDPCLRGLPDVARPVNGDADSASESDSDRSESQVGSRLLTCLLDQITALKMANERLNKELMDTRTELESYRQQAMFYPKGPTMMGAPPNHSPLVSNGLVGGQYSPGFLSDLVREIRDAARVREEAMYSRVRTMVLERSENGLAPSEGKFMEKSLEDIKSSLRASEADKRRVMDRVARLEDELRTLRLTNGDARNDTTIISGDVEETDSDKMLMRKELSELRKAKQNAEDHALKLERLVTQLRSKFNGLQLSNGPESLPSDVGADHENMRVRRTSVNSSTNSTVVFGPVTDL